MRLSPVLKMVVGLCVAMVALMACEAATRGYVAIRGRRPDAWRYGFSFWDSVRLGATAAAVREGVAPGADQTGPDRFFVDRQQLAVEPDRPSEIVRVAGFDVRFNRWGLRGVDVASLQPRNTRRVLLLGGSFVFGWGLPDEAIWPVRLAQHLGRTQPVEVVNGGGNGGTINWALMTLVRLTRRTTFDTVVVLSTYNNRTLLAVDGRPTWSATAEHYLYNTSLLYVVLEEKISQLRHQALDYEHLQSAVRVTPGALDEWRSLYRRRLEQIATICRERQMALVVGAEPERFFDSRLDALSPGDAIATRQLRARLDTGHTISRSELSWLLQSLQIAEMRALESHAKAKFIDTASAFTPAKAVWMMDEIHPNRRGSEEFATFVAQLITQ
jgi:hypothetical protein